MTFDHAIEVAQATPALTSQTLTILTLVGLLLGLAPVAIGLLAYPAIRQAGPSTLRFLLALTIGLLVFLMVDTLCQRRRNNQPRGGGSVYHLGNVGRTLGKGARLGTRACAKASSIASAG